MKIGELARTAGVGVETVRFYERKGLIARPPRPRDGTFRSYPAETALRIRIIRQAQELGFSLKEAADLLALEADPAADCSAVRDRARAKIEAVDAKMEKLAAIRAALEQLVAACPGRGAALRRCSILNALSGGEDGGDAVETDGRQP